MKITSIRMKLVGMNVDDGVLKAFFTTSFDDELVVRDMKVISSNDKTFIGFPNRRITDRCPVCKLKNALTHKYCCHCGGKLGEKEQRAQAISKSRDRMSFYADVVHPVRTEFRYHVQEIAMKAYMEATRQRIEHCNITFDSEGNITDVAEFGQGEFNSPASDETGAGENADGE
jgi:DNA-binding cell septation regulator SpoVG